METRRFIRYQEDFTCERCGTSVCGTGYTNHCPECFTSKHVDIFPGDRAADCGGLMPPVRIEEVKGRYRVTQRCERCGHEARNRTDQQDNMIALAKKANEIVQAAFR